MRSQNRRVFVTSRFTITENAYDSKTTDWSHVVITIYYFLFTPRTRRQSCVRLMGIKQYTHLNDAYFRTTKNKNNIRIGYGKILYNILSAAVQNVKHVIKTLSRFRINAIVEIV